MKTSELIKLLQTLDPEEDKYVVVLTDDYLAYDVHGGKLGGCHDGVTNDEESDVVILSAQT